MDCRIDDIIHEGSALAEELERGQAERPLGTWFEEAHHEFQGQPLVVTVITSSESARQTLLGTLVEDAFRSVAIRQTVYPGLLEIMLSGSGYALEVSGQRRIEFDALPALLDALQTLTSPGNTGEADVSIWRVSLRSPPERQGLQLLVPESLDAITRSPALESVIVARSHLLAVAVGENTGLNSGETALLQRLSMAIGYALPLSASETLAPAESLRRDLGFARTAIVLPAESLATLPGVLVASSPASAIRQKIQQSAAAKRLLLACETVQVCYETDMGQLQSRRQRDEALTRSSTSPEQSGRRGVDTLRQKAGGDFSSLLRIVDETGRRALLPDSVIGKRLRELIELLRSEDLRQETEHQQITLSLDERYQHEFQKELKKAIKEQFKQDMSAIREALVTLRQRAERDMESSGQPSVLSWVEVGDDELWRRISELMSFEVRYRGQMPKRRFLQRLGEGRRIVFGALMVASLLGTFAGINLRQYWPIGVILLSVFIWAVWKSYGTWRADDESRLQSELQKVRDQLQQEGRRVVGELLQEKRLRIAEYIEQQKRHYLQQLESLDSARTEREIAAAQEQRERATHRLRQLDAQLKDLQGLGPRLTRLRQDVIKLQNDTEREIRDLLSKGVASG